MLPQGAAHSHDLCDLWQHTVIFVMCFSIEIELKLCLLEKLCELKGKWLVAAVNENVFLMY
jgi:hypothetical protein